MPRYRNTDDHARVWPDLTAPDGSTVHLEPGEEIDLDSDVEAAWLAPVAAQAKKPAKATGSAPEATAEPAAADPKE